MYKLEILPIATEDIENIIHYISCDLSNISATKKLRDLIINSFNNILEFPYGVSAYQPSINLKNEYRGYRVKNYIIFYTINEEENTITIVRVLHKKMHISSVLK